MGSYLRAESDWRALLIWLAFLLFPVIARGVGRLMERLNQAGGRAASATGGAEEKAEATPKSRPVSERERPARPPEPRPSARPARAPAPQAPRPREATRPAPLEPASAGTPTALDATPRLAPTLPRAIPALARGAAVGGERAPAASPPPTTQELPSAPALEGARPRPMTTRTRAWRRGIVLSEILRPPLALRAPDDEELASSAPPMPSAGRGRTQRSS